MDRILTPLCRPGLSGLATIALAMAALAILPFSPGRALPVSAQEGEPQGEGTADAGVEILDLNLGVPTLEEPADDSFPEFTPTFVWSEVGDIDGYVLEYTSDPTCNFGAGTTVQVKTFYTRYTPTQPFPNDVNYCWRVRTYKGSTVSAWSSTFTFIKRWYFPPQLLTPVKGHQYVRDELMSWTPVPGASFYKIEINDENSFPPVKNTSKWIKCTSNPFYNFHDFAFSGTMYWRVIPYETNSAGATTGCKSRGNQGQPSEVSSFRGVHPDSGDYPSPHLFYPLYYYVPNENLDQDQDMIPYEDRSVAWPIFQWHRTLAGDDQHEVAAYRIQVDDSPTFTSINFTADTQNLSVAPTSARPFNGLGTGVYYWRVCALDGLGGDCLPDPVNSLPMWSQVWAVRFDSNLRPSPTTGAAPTLLRPADAHESVETFPLLEWWPYSGASRYQVEISVDPGFATGQVVDQALTLYPGYTPFTKLDYSPSDPTADLPYGTYFWRVRALDSQGQPLGGWSVTRRFQVAAQSHWIYTRTPLSLSNRWQVAADPDDVSNDGDELRDLFVAQDSAYWYFGFHTNAPAGDQAYGLYVDLDHVSGSGANFDPEGFTLNTVSHHRPEYAVYLLPANPPSSYTAGNVWIYAWDTIANNKWKSPPQSLLSMGGGLYIDGDYFELKIPNFGIGMEEKTGSMALSLFSLNESTKVVVDTVPGGSASTLNRFASVSERLTLASPPTNATGDPTTYPSVLPFFWHWPPVTDWEGYRIEVALDQLFTTSVYTLELTAANPYLAAPLHTPYYDFNGDNTYYWRVRPQYWKTSINLGGAWSQPMRFERKGFTTKDLVVNFDMETPIFTWQRLEGAEAYELEVDDDPEFGSPAIKDRTTQVIYNPVKKLTPGEYHLRVRPLRHNEFRPSEPIRGDWASTTLVIAGEAGVYLPIVMRP